MKRLLLIFIVAIAVNYLNAQVTITVNTGTKKQTIRGMGCQDDLEGVGSTNDDLLYDLGASSYRAFAGENSEGGWNEPSNDNADPAVLNLAGFPDMSGARLAAYQKAAKRGCVFYMTIGSPPAWMKTNNSGVNGGSLRTDMTTAAFEEFGEFVLGVTQKFKAQTGVDLYALSLQNEPEFPEPYYSCVYSGTTYRDAAKAIITRYQAAGITTKLAYGEQCFTQNHVISWAQLGNNDALLKDNICALAVHTYDSDPFGGGDGTQLQWTAFYNEANRVTPVKEVWMSEGGTTGKGIEDALAAGWVFYKAIEYGHATLFSHRYLGRTTAAANYFGIKNMIRYLRPGTYLLGTTTSDLTSVLALAFKNDASGAYTLYLVNRSTSDKTINVTWSGATGKFEMFRTSLNENCEWKGQVELANAITIPTKSIVTLVSCSANKIPNIDMPDTIVIIKGAGSKVVNLTGINNGGEAGQPISMKAWSKEGGANLFSNVALSYTSPNTTGTITLTPISSVVGNTKIMVSLNDKSLTMDSMFNEKVIGIPVYIVPYINKAPTMNDVDDQSYAKSTINATQLITLTNVTDGNDGKQKLTLTATSSMPWIAEATTQGTTLVKITPKAEGTVTITLTLTDDGVNAGGGAGSITKSFTVVIGSGINAFDEPKNELQIYPIPAHDQINIDNKDMKIQSWLIADLTGKIVLSGKALDEKVEINMAGLVPGVYLIRMITADGNITKKIIIE